MDYSTYNNANINVNNQMQQPVMPRKVDVKGVIMAVVCMITAIITAVSIFMPIMSINYNYTSSGVNIIDMIKAIVGVFDESSFWEWSDALEVAVMVIVIIVMMLPIVLAIISIIQAIVYCIKLAKLKPVKRVNAFAKTILFFEMIFATFTYYIYQVMSWFGESGAVSSYFTGVSLSVGWYLPVILAFFTLILRFIFDVVDSIKQGTNTRERIVAAIFGGIGAVMAFVMYMAYGLSQFAIHNANVDVNISAAFFNRMLMYGYDVICIFILVFIVIITLLSQILMSRSLKAVLKSKFCGIFAIVTGTLSIAFAIANYIIFGMYCESEVGVDATMNMGVASYLYIIMGAVLVVLGIVYLCIRTYMKNSCNVVMQQQAMQPYIMQQPNIQQSNMQQLNMQQPITQQINSNNQQNVLY